MKLKKIRKLARLARKLSRAGDPIGALEWFALSLAGSNKLMRVKVGGSPIIIRASSTDLGIVLENLGGEFDEAIAYVPALKHGLIIDAGGYLGTAAIAFAEAFPDAKIVTLEPSPENFALLERNVAAYPNIHALNMAVGDEAGSLELRDRGTGFSGLTVVKDPADNPASARIVTVELTTIPTILQEFGMDGADIIKIDIEGAERELLRGNVDWLKQSSVVCIELHDRIAGGCSEAWQQATAGRINTKLEGEKFLSVRR
jgi:FkbM family methyltransferase